MQAKRKISVIYNVGKKYVVLNYFNRVKKKFVVDILNLLTRIIAFS